MEYSYKNLSRFMAAIAFISLTVHANASVVIFEGGWDGYLAFLLPFVGALYWVSGLSAIYGLWNFKIFGGVSFVIYVILGMYFFSFSVIPFIPQVFLFSVQFWAVIALNVTSMLIAVWANWKSANAHNSV